MKTRTISQVLAVLWLLCVAANNASAVPVSLAEGESVTLNFDLTGAIPGPTYDSLDIYWQLDGYDETTESLSFAFYEELDAVNLLITFFSTADPFGLNLPAAHDGQFSFVVTAVTGAFSLDAYAVGHVNGGQTGPVYATIAGGEAEVPEPSTLALFGLGLLGLGFARSRRD